MKKEKKEQKTEVNEEIKEEIKTEEEAKEPSELEKKQAELDALDDKYKRVLAEYDNFRKRSMKERDAFFRDGECASISAFLPLIDNLERAAAATNDEGAQKLLKQAQDILEKMNVHPCGKAGDAFDPNFHNAVVHIEDENLGENVIAEVLLCGYTKGDRLIRPAMVKTAN